MTMNLQSQYNTPQFTQLPSQGYDQLAYGESNAFTRQNIPRRNVSISNQFSQLPSNQGYSNLPINSNNSISGPTSAQYIHAPSNIQGPPNIQRPSNTQRASNIQRASNMQPESFYGNSPQVNYPQYHQLHSHNHPIQYAPHSYQSPQYIPPHQGYH
jgi:hypothetical protein